jgi:CheY-like chemotaxis protein
MSIARSETYRMNALNKLANAAKTVLGMKPPAALVAQKTAVDEAMRAKVRPKRILIADDDEFSIELFVEASRGWRYELIALTSVHDTQAYLASGETLAAAILDVAFMNGDGISVYRWIAANRPQLKVAFLTNYLNPALIDLIAIIGPAWAFPKADLGKPGFVDQLMQKLEIDRVASVVG